MKTYLIGYDLNKSGQDYKKLIDQIKKIGTWWHCLDSTWIIKCKDTYTAVSIRDYLKKYIDSNDELLVVRLSGEGAWCGFSQDCSKWLKDNL